MSVELPRLGSKRILGPGVATLSPGTPVFLCASAPGARRRCHSFAARTGIEIGREYLAYPSAVAPAYLVEDAPDSARLFFGSVLTDPPRPGFGLVLAGGLRLLRALASWRGIRRIAPGRVVVGRRI